MTGTIDRNPGRGNRLRPLIWGAAACLLLLPLLAMQFTTEVNWDATDFLVFGSMLLAACGSYELAVRMSANRAYRAGFGIAILVAFVTVWINLAVGIIGDENNPANLIFFGVLALAIIAAAVASFRPVGMVRAMLVTAVVQGLAGIYAVAAGSVEGAVLSLCLVGAWLVSAYLFSVASRGLGGDDQRPIANV